MSLPHLIFCRDSARRDPSGKWIEWVEGWCVATAPISALGLHSQAGEFENIARGFSRPDVAQLYYSYPANAHAGFRALTRWPAEQPARLCVQVDRGATHERHLLAVDLGTSDIQTIDMGETTLIRGAEDERLAVTIAEATAPEKRLRESLQKRRGITLRLDLINKCNLRCTMCSFSDDAVFKRPTRQLTFEQFKAIFEELGPHVREVVLSCGDEPLLSRFLPEILQFLKAEHPEIEIGFCTNATLLRASIRRVIIETGVASLLFSVDAVTKPLFEKIRTGARYETVIGNIMALRDLKKISGAARPRVVFNYVLMKQNIHEAPAFVTMAKALGGEVIDFRHVVVMFAGYDPEQPLSAHPVLYNYYRHQITAEAEKFGMEIYLPPPFEPVGQDFEAPPTSDRPDFLADFRRVEADPAKDEIPTTVPRADLHMMRQKFAGCAADEFSSTFCNRPFSEVMVRDQDEVLPCPWYGRPLGRLHEGKTLSDIFFNDDFAQLRRNMLTAAGDPGCRDCPIKAGQLSTR